MFVYYQQCYLQPWVGIDWAMKKVVEYVVVDAGEFCTYLFYNRAEYEGEECWLWDDHKRTYEEAIKAYPLEEYHWVFIEDDD